MLTFPPTTLRGNFLIVTFSVENTSEGPVTLTEDSMALLDPGEKREGRVNFDLSVPIGADPSADLSGFRLELGDGDPTVEEEELIDPGL